MSDEIPSRRNFLTATMAWAASAAFGRAARAQVGVTGSSPGARRSIVGGAPASVRLGVASYSLRAFPLAQALEMMKSLRTPYVNFKSFHIPYDKSPEELTAIRRQIETAGFIIVGGGTITFETDSDDGVRRYFDYARAAGMPLIVATGHPSVLPRVERFAKQYDIKVAIHNHGPDDKNYPSPYDALKYIKDMDPRMGLCMDLGHSARTGIDLVKAIHDAGPRLLDMHAKDLRDLSSAESQCIVGEGVLPLVDIFRALSQIRYPGYVNLEYEIDEKDPLPGMKQSFAYMRGVVRGLGIEGAGDETRRG